MVAYSFQRQFVEPIRKGIKQQTIRAVGLRRHAVPGDELQLYCGMRTRGCFLIGRYACVGVSPIVLAFNADLARHTSSMVSSFGSSAAEGACDRVLVLDAPSLFSLDDFARKDGFADWAALRAFWREHHPEVREHFEGVIIFWRGLIDE